MKINSRKFLILSYALSGKSLGYEHLEYLWPDLTPGGRRGLIAYLLKQRLISARYEGKKAFFEISSIGISLIEETYFTKKLHEPSQGCFVMLYPDVVLTEPKLVKLRALLKSQCSEVTPKVYFTSVPLSEEFLAHLKKLYFSYIAVFTVREWLLGEKNLFENSYLQKKDGENSLSGISNEVSKLIEEKTSYSHANHQSNVRIFSLYDRVLTIIEGKIPLEAGNDTQSLPAIELLRRFSLLF